MTVPSLGRRSLMAAALLALSLPNAAWAACARSDLGGKYELHIFASTDEGSTTWTRCAMTVKPNGSLKTDTACSNDRGGTGVITGGKLKLRRNCSVTGRIEIDSVVATLDHGIMKSDKDAFTGLGRSDNDLLLQVTATKR